LKLSIAIPDSALVDESTLLEKSKKISIVARACAIFQVDTIYIYHDGDGNKNDLSTLVTILKYLETPQYLRKKLYPKMFLLKYAGILHPLKISSHTVLSNPKKIKIGDIREGIIVSVKGKRFFDVGINYLIPYFGREKVGKRLTIMIKSTLPKISAVEISREQVPYYWGYKIKERNNLASFLKLWDGNVIFASRKGVSIGRMKTKFFIKSQKPTLVVYGSPTKGLYEILGNNINTIKNSRIFNFFPNQATETVRLEEAIIGSLSILNIFLTD